MTPEQMTVVNRALDADHFVISTDGWVCDTCGVAVNGQTDDQGVPLLDGDSVRHTMLSPEEQLLLCGSQMPRLTFHSPLVWCRKPRGHPGQHGGITVTESW